MVASCILWIINLILSFSVYWSAWGQWSACSKTCGASGVHFRKRKCIRQKHFCRKPLSWKKMGWKKLCKGDNFESRPCVYQSCCPSSKWIKNLMRYNCAIIYAKIGVWQHPWGGGVMVGVLGKVAFGLKHFWILCF